MSSPTVRFINTRQEVLGRPRPPRRISVQPELIVDLAAVLDLIDGKVDPDVFAQVESAVTAAVAVLTGNPS